MLEVIVFDFGGVLFSFDRQRFVRALASRSHLSAPELYRLLYAQPSVFLDYELGKISTDEFFEGVARLGRLHNVSRGVFESLYTQHTPVAPVLECIPALALKFRLAVLSNTSELHFKRILMAHPVSQYFQQFILSYELGALKPDRSLYEQAITALHVSPGQILFVDDTPANLLPAELLGMRTHLLTLPASVDFLKKIS